MPQPAPTPYNDLQRIEIALLEEVRRTHRAWIDAPEEERDRARIHFMMALHALNTLALYDKELD